MLSIKNLHAAIDGKDILKGLNLEVKAGEVHAIMGPNGTGKSTLASILAGLDKYEIKEGSIIYKGIDLNHIATNLTSGIGYSFKVSAVNFNGEGQQSSPPSIH